MRRLVRATKVLVLATAVALLATGCGDDAGGDGDDEATDTVTTTSGSESSQQGEDHDEDDADHGDDGQPPIQIESPATFASVHGSFVLSGTARVHEAELGWTILGEDLKPITSGRMTASCGAPCRGDFRTTVPLSKVPVGSWELHVFQPPVADDDPERVHDVILPITVTADPVDEDTPAADAPPPGGVPG